VSASPFLAGAAGFALGAIPFGWLLALLLGRGDLRLKGSGNIGATNVFRVAGPGIALLTLALDAAKGAAAVALARAIGGADGLSAEAGGLGAVAGHVFTPWLGFRGGKGAATTAGALAVLAPLPLLVSLAVFAAVAGLTRWVSAGSLAAAGAFPAFALAFSAPPSVVASGVAVAAMLLFSHRRNVARLLTGREPRLRRGRTGGEGS
jgi:glycerol-3-phosphate acyltransferase PlsY